MGTAVLVRGATLAQLLAAALFLDDLHFQWVAVALGVAAAAQVFTDSGAAAFLSVADEDRMPLPVVVRQLIVWQLLAGCLALCLAALLLLRVADTAGPSTLLGLMAIPATSAAESVGRLGRVIWLRQGRLASYAGVDATYAAARTVSVVLVAAGAGVLGFVAGFLLAAWATRHLVSRAVRGLAAVLDRRGASPSFVATARRSLSYGLPVMAAGLYSQSPVVVTGAFSSLETAAAVAVATRIVQPLEMVAVSWSQLSLPGLARGDLEPRRFQGVLAVQGCVMALLGAAGAALFLHLAGVGAEVWLLTALLLVVLPVKYLSYGFATRLMALERPDLRMRAGLAVGVVGTCVLVGVAAQALGVIAATMMLNELVLVLGLGAVVHHLGRERVRRDG